MSESISIIPAKDSAKITIVEPVKHGVSAITPTNTPNPLASSEATMSDEALFELCQKYGKNAKIWMRKFACLLPEVFKRQLYRRKRFASIHEFAACLAGMNHAATDQVISLFRVLEDKPILRGLIEEYGWSKVRVVASISTPATDEFWAGKVKILSKGALETYVRGLREQEERKMLGCGAGVDSRGSGADVGYLESGASLPLSSFGTDGGTDGETDGKIYEATIVDPCHFFPGEKLQPVNRAQIGIFRDQNSKSNGLQGGGFYEYESGSGDKLENGLREGYGYGYGYGYGRVLNTLSIRLDEDTEFKLRLLKQKLEKKTKREVNFGEVVRYMISQIEKMSTEGAGMSETREVTSGVPKVVDTSKTGKVISGVPKVVDTSKTREVTSGVPKSVTPNTVETGKTTLNAKKFSRYIPACIRKELAEMYKQKCAYPGCKFPADHIHHTDRFSINGTHDLRYMKPLCKHHHDIAHASLIKNETSVDPKSWELKPVGRGSVREAVHSVACDIVDQKYIKYKLT